MEGNTSYIVLHGRLCSYKMCDRVINLFRVLATVCFEPLRYFIAVFVRAHKGRFHFFESVAHRSFEQWIT